MKIRKYHEPDWTRICEIHDLARLDELKGAGLVDAFLPLTIAAERENLFSYNLLVAEMDDGVVGFIAFDDDEIAWLYVDPQCYRKGVGKALVKAAIDSNTEPYFIEVLVGNDTALNFYKSCGFQEIGKASGQMPGNEKFEVTVHELSNEATEHLRGS